MARERLTSRNRQAAAEGAKPDHKTPYPGTVNQEDRKFPDNEKYDNFEQNAKTHEGQDLRHEWKNDKHDENGIGIPEPWGKKGTIASVKAIKMAASKAVKAAVLFLGDKVPEKMIEAQAKDFMAMGPEALTRSIERFSSTFDLYEKGDDKCDCGKADCKCDKGDCKCAEAKTASMDAPAPVVAPAAPAMPPMPEPVPAAPAAPVACTAVAEPAPEAFDVSMDSNEAMPEESQGDADALANLFGPQDNTELGKTSEAAPKVAATKSEQSVKQGIKSIGGQVKLASTGSDDELTGIWETSPDVNAMFRS
jgi:hypothetical protein